MVLQTVRQFEPIVRTLAREGIARSVKIDPILLRAGYCGGDEEEEEEEKKREEEDEDEEEEEEEEEEWKVLREASDIILTSDITEPHQWPMCYSEDLMPPRFPG